MKWLSGSNIDPLTGEEIKSGEICIVRFDMLFYVWRSRMKNLSNLNSLGNASGFGRGIKLFEFRKYVKVVDDL